MNRITQFAGKVYPDFSFSIGRVPTPKKLKADSQYDKDYDGQHDEYYDVQEANGKRFTNHEKFWSGFNDYDRFNKSPESSQKNKTYGRQGITRYGR